MLDQFLGKFDCLNYKILKVVTVETYNVFQNYILYY